MFSNRSSISRGCSLAVVAFAAVAACVGLVGTASASVIYSDTFTGSSTLGSLNGATPNTVDTNSATWTSTSSSSYGWADSGYSIAGTLNNNRQNAYLPFTPVNGQIYPLSAGLDVTGTGPGSAVPGSNLWMAIGFIAPPVPSTTSGWDCNTVRKMLTQNQRRINTILTCAFAPDMFYCQP